MHGFVGSVFICFVTVIDLGCIILKDSVRYQERKNEVQLVNFS